MNAYETRIVKVAEQIAEMARVFADFMDEGVGEIHIGRAKVGPEEVQHAERDYELMYELLERCGIEHEFERIEKSEFDDACPGCGCKPGDGYTDGCMHPMGCGFFREIEAKHEKATV